LRAICGTPANRISLIRLVNQVPFNLANLELVWQAITRERIIYAQELLSQAAHGN
jgi:hypothetical protein